MRESKGLKPLYIATFLRGISSTIIRVFLPVYAFTMGISIDNIGFIVTIATAISVLMLPIMGYLTDVVSRRLALILSTTFLALSSTLLVLYATRIIILLAFILFYASFFSWQSARGALVVDEVPEGARGKVFAFLSLAFWIPRTIIPYVAGIIITYLGYNYVFLLSMLSSIIAILMLTSIPKKTPDDKKHYLSKKEILRGIIPSRREIPLYVILSLDRIGWTLWLPLLNPLMKAELALSEDKIGLLNTTMNIATILVLLPSGKIVDSYGWKTGLLLSEMSIIMGLLPLILSVNIYYLAILMIAIGISIGLWLPSFNTAIPSIINNSIEAGRSYSKANMYRTIASIPSPWIGGALYTILPIYPLIVGCIILIANVVLIALKIGKERFT